MNDLVPASMRAGDPARGCLGLVGGVVAEPAVLAKGIALAGNIAGERGVGDARGKIGDLNHSGSQSGYALGEETDA